MATSLNIKSLILDMDGVIWRGDAAIGNLPDIFTRITRMDVKFIFATNNGSRTPGQYVERLAKYGVKIDPWQVVTSSITLAHLLEKRFPTGGPVFAIGEDGVLEALRTKGFHPLPVEKTDDALAVIVGIDRMITFQKMVEATLLVRRGIPFYATNADRTFPTLRGEIPGAGAWIAVITTATGREPIYAGKPAPELLELACERLGTAKLETLVVGDRLETDIAGGQVAGLPVAAVLSGVSTLEEINAWEPHIDLIANDLGDLIGKIS